VQTAENIKRITNDYQHVWQHGCISHSRRFQPTATSFALCC